jgi:outer membrane protein assembly factor BamA
LRFIVFIGLYIGFSFLSVCDAQEYFSVNNIFIIGNQKTKEDIILRELGFAKGDKISNNLLPEKIEKAKNQLLNTTLFTEVDVFADSNSNIFITVLEDWYIWPHIIFEVADRNFNQWWIEKDLSRLNLGTDIRLKNFSGRNDQLNFQIAGGYTRHIMAYYMRPFIDKNKHWGFGLGLKYNANREVWIKPENDKVVFFSMLNNNFLIRRFMTQADLTYRKGIFDKHILTYNFGHTAIADTVVSAEGNPHFLMGQKSQIQSNSLCYTYIYDKRDIRAYPFKGYFLKSITEIERYSNQKNNITLGAHFYKFQHISTKFYSSIGVIARYSTLAQVPYENFRALGYDNTFVRGYEYYVIDGKDYGLIRTNLKYALIKDKKIKLQYMPKAFRELNLCILTGVFYDMGYVNSPFVYANNRLPNTLLQGYGIGIDWVLFYNRVIRTEYSFNAMGEQGFYLSFYAPI